MEVGVGLPTTTPGADGPRAGLGPPGRGGPFSSLGVLDRMVYHSLDPFVALAAAAAVTPGSGWSPWWPSGRSGHRAAGQAGRLGPRAVRRAAHAGAGHRGPARGLRAPGVDRGRPGQAPRRAAGRAPRDVGEAQVGPGRPAGRPDAAGGGLRAEAFARVARFADGYVHGGGPPRAFAGAAAGRGRPGRTRRGRAPELWGQGYFALGDADAGRRLPARLLRLHRPVRREGRRRQPHHAEAVRDFVRGYEEAGCDELVLLPTVPTGRQLDRLADVLG